MNTVDLARLQHMLDAAREAVLFAQGRTLEDVQRDRMLLLSLVKEIEIIGEAASRMSPEARAAIAGIPWSQVMGMRNRLTHGYFEWEIDTIWDTVNTDLPDLIRVLEQVLRSLS